MNHLLTWLYWVKISFGIVVRDMSRMVLRFKIRVIILIQIISCFFDHVILIWCNPTSFLSCPFWLLSDD